MTHNDLRYEFRTTGGWQLWGETFDPESDDLLKESITRHHEGAGRTSLIMFEKLMTAWTGTKESNLRQSKQLLGTTQQTRVRVRVEKCVALVESESHKTYEQQ